MDMQADIKWIQAELETLKDPSLIDMLKRLIQYGKSQKEIVSDEFLANYNESIDHSLAQIDQGNYFTQEQMREKFAQWQKRK